MASLNIACPHCMRTFVRHVSHINQVVTRSGKWSCRSCATTARNIAIAKPVGATRIHNQSGYVEEKTASGWRRQHILVVERRIGRRLLPGEMIHHVNEVKTDNRDENLVLMRVGEHTTFHHTGAKRPPSTVAALNRTARARSTTRLSVSAAAEIRELANAMTQRQIAEAFGVSKTTINRVVNNATWR